MTISDMPYRTSSLAVESARRPSKITDVGRQVEPFAAVPIRILDLVASGQLDPIDIAVITALLGFARSRPWTDSTATQLATRIRRSEGTVRRSLGRLESAGLIVREGQVKLLTWRGQGGQLTSPTPGTGDCPPSRRRPVPLAPVTISPLAPALASVEGSQSQDGVDRNDDISTSAINQILSLTSGADQAAIDRAAHAAVADLGDAPERIDLHKRNLAKVARGDRDELLRILVSLLAGRRARIRGQAGGRAFASTYLAFTPPDPTQADQVIVQVAAELRALDQAAHQAQAAVAQRARQADQARVDRAEGERHRAGLRRALATLTLPPDVGPPGIIQALSSVDVSLSVQRLAGLRPCLMLSDDLAMGDLPLAIREAVECYRLALADMLDPRIG